MTNPMFRKALIEMMEEEKHYKTCLIEDIMKAERLLCNPQETPTPEIISNPAAIFDRLYDMSINDLEITNGLISIRLEKKMKQQMDSFMNMLSKGGQP